MLINNGFVEHNMEGRGECLLAETVHTLSLLVHEAGVCEFVDVLLTLHMFGASLIFLACDL